jgi:hypothetical protein
MKISALLFLLLIASTIPSFSQTKDLPKNLQRYEGPYTLNEYEQGVASYSYTVDKDGNHIKSGIFSYRNEFFDNDNKLIQRHFSGNYTNGLKSGKWNYSNHVYDINLITVTEKLQLKADINGVRTRLEGNYVNGKAHGQWKFEEQKIKNEREIGVMDVTTLNFKDGRMVGSFRYRSLQVDNLVNVEGRFNDDHFMHGKWVLEYITDSIPIREFRTYENGFLLDLRIIHVLKDSVLTDITYNRVREKLENINSGEPDLPYQVGDRYFGFLFDDGFPELSSYKISQLQGNKILEKAITPITARRISGLNLEGIEALLPGATRRFVYTYTEAESNALSETSQKLQHYISYIDGVINNPTLTLHRQRSDTLAFTYKFLANTLDKLNILKENVALLESDEFKYQSRNTYFANGIEGVHRVDTIRYTFDEEERVRLFDNDVSIRDEAGIVFNLQAYVDVKANTIERLAPFVSASITEIERDLINTRTEQNILLHIDSVTAVFNVDRGINSVDQYNIPLTRTLVSLYDNYQRKLDSKMQEYSTASEFEIRQAAAMNIIEMSQIYIDAYQQLGVLPRRLEVLNQSYMKLSYNPYMDTYDIPTRIKRNIYTASILYLIPYIQNQVVNAEDYREIPSHLTTLEQTFDRLLEISELEDSATKSMERRLRRENNPERIKRILNINI